MCARLGITLGTPHRDRPINDVQCIPDPKFLPLNFEDTLYNANRLAEEVAFDLLPDRLRPPPAVVPDGYDADGYLESICREALLGRYMGPDFPAARDRLERELYTLRSLGFSDFFLVCHEVMSFCKSRGILASGRGSAAGSVVCYLLGIIQADPVSNDLLFERFLHSGKRAMPDIDIDISSSRRDEVFAWVERRFPTARWSATASPTTCPRPCKTSEERWVCLPMFAIGSRTHWAETSGISGRSERGKRRSSSMRSLAKLR